MKKGDPARPRNGLQTRWFYALFFLSGLTALVYETAFARQLQLIFGSTLSAVSVVIAVFFGGLALGAVLIGPKADRYSPLRLYGLLEIGIGLWAIVAVLLIPVIRGLYAHMSANLDLPTAAQTSLQVTLSVVILLPATILMGATLPALSRGMTRTMGHRFSRIGALYSMNTIGATAGTLLCGFLLLEHLGYLKTIIAAMAVNFAIGITAFILAPRNTPNGSQTEPSASQATAAPLNDPGTTKSGLRSVLLIIAAISGFAALGYEVVWFRTLAFTVVTDTYAFALMLGIYLLGIGAGSMVAARRFRALKHQMNASRAWFELGLAELLVALAVVLGFSILVWLGTELPKPTTIDPVYWAKTLRNTSIQAVVLILPATLVLGYIFPLIVSLYAASIRRLAGQVGRVTACNTSGGIAGSLAAGFLLIPLAGIQKSLLILIGFSMAVGVAALLCGPIERRRRTFGLLLTVPVAGVMFLVYPMRADFGFKQIASHEKARLLYYRESADQTVMVTEDLGDRGVRRLLINRQQATSTYLPGQRKNHLMGHLPLWACPGAQTALVICLGSGGTFGALGLYDLDRVDCVEICSAVIDAASFFTEWNGNVLERANTNIIIDDGRSYLLTTGQTYDVITLEPMHPGLKGVSALYSVEFYQEAKRKLNDNGVLCQWVPLYSMSAQDAKALLATALAVFPQTGLWLVGSEGILLCARDSLQLDWVWLTGHLSNPKIKDVLKKVHLDDHWTLLSGYLLGPAGMKEYTRNAPLVYDDRPFIEYTIPRHQHIFPWDAILALSKTRESPVSIIRGIPPAELDDLGSEWRGRKATWYARDQGFAAIALGDYATAYRNFEIVLANDPTDSYAAHFLKEIYWRYGVELSRQQRWAEAVQLYARAAALQPDDPKGHFYLGVALNNAGRISEAIAALERCLALQPDFDEARKFLRNITR
ncbi:fused MFS/spermidine synthase [candidate division WOR-3 bacterium]|nr:fused MFS/spermidine synthase [candidate division WOR-3 bacterium]